jgi:hypothetical protein
MPGNPWGDLVDASDVAMPDKAVAAVRTTARPNTAVVRRFRDRVLTLAIGFPSFVLPAALWPEASS